MAILFGLVIAALAVIGWCYGNLFVCVFLTLPLLIASGACASDHQTFGAVAFLSMILAVWLPRWIRQSAY
jgi:hypothetical protein